MAAARTKAAAAVDNVDLLPAGFAELTARRSELAEQRDTILAAPVPRTEAAPTIDKVMNGLAAKIRDERYGSYLASHPHEWPAVVEDLGDIGRSIADRAPRVPVAALFAVVAPDQLRRWLEAELAGAYATLPTPVAAATRATKAAELDRGIATLERQAADLWWAAVDLGLQLPPPQLITAAAALGLEP